MIEVRRVSILTLLSMCVGALVSAELEDGHQIVMYILEEDPGLCFMAELLFLDCFPFVLAFPHFP